MKNENPNITAKNRKDMKIMKKNNTVPKPTSKQTGTVPVWSQTPVPTINTTDETLLKNTAAYPCMPTPVDHGISTYSQVMKRCTEAFIQKYASQGYPIPEPCVVLGELLPEIRKRCKELQQKEIMGGERLPKLAELPAPCLATILAHTKRFVRIQISPNSHIPSRLYFYHTEGPFSGRYCAVVNEDDEAFKFIRTYNYNASIQYCKDVLKLLLSETVILEATPSAEWVSLDYCLMNLTTKECIYECSNEYKKMLGIDG